MKTLEIIELFNRKDLTIDEIIETLEENFYYVKKEGNGFGYYIYDDSDDFIYFYRLEDKKIFTLKSEWKNEIVYSGTNIIDYSIEIFKGHSDDGETIYSNVNWNESVIYYDECYPDWLVEEWEGKETED